MAKKIDSKPKQQVTVCSIKMLPQDQWQVAARNAKKLNAMNAPNIHQFNQGAGAAPINPDHLALLTTKYWGINGVNLTVGFLDNPEVALKTKILSHMNAWGSFCNVKFTETTGKAQVRISRAAGGYWSYLGTDILQIPDNQPTMNLEGFSMNTSDSEFFRVVRHETGHTLGFPHEHLRSEIIDKIDRQKAIKFFMESQGWSEEQVISQVLTPLTTLGLNATEHADVNSIMCYSLPGVIMKDGKSIVGGKDINTKDAQFAAKIYPKVVVLNPCSSFQQQVVALEAQIKSIDQQIEQAQVEIGGLSGTSELRKVLTKKITQFQLQLQTLNKQIISIKTAHSNCF